jgi:LPS export ABC transporter protein LptC
MDLTCDEGELVMETHALLAKGNVRGHTADGRAFSTTWVRYDPKREVAFTDAPVQIDDESGSLHGGGFRYHVREGRFRLLGGATVRREN